jgi:hypothetical protein
VKRVQVRRDHGWHIKSLPEIMSQPACGSISLYTPYSQMTLLHVLRYFEISESPNYINMLLLFLVYCSYMIKHKLNLVHLLLVGVMLVLLFIFLEEANARRVYLTAVYDLLNC